MRASAPADAGSAPGRTRHRRRSISAGGASAGSGAAPGSGAASVIPGSMAGGSGAAGCGAIAAGAGPGSRAVRPAAPPRARRGWLGGRGLGGRRLGRRRRPAARPRAQRSPARVADAARASGRLEQGELQLEAQAAGAEARRVDAGQAAGRRGEAGLGGAAGRQAREQLLAQRVDDLVQEHAQVPAALLEAVEEDDARGGVPAGERGDEPVHQLGVGEAQEVPHGVGLDAVRRSSRAAGPGSTPRRACRRRPGGRSGGSPPDPPRGRRPRGCAPACR